MDIVNRNLENVRSRIQRAALKKGKDPGEIKLVVVTKNVPIDLIKEVIKAGVNDLGENRTNELLDKQDQLTANVKWHFIGHLQRNKVRDLIGRVELIQSLDSLRLADEIEKQASKTAWTQDVLVEVNIGGEEGKYGIPPGELKKFLQDVSERIKHVKINGLMAMAPFFEDPEETRPLFARMRAVFDELRKIEIPQVDMQILSMGMSNDFEIAIEEGANMIRIGSAIFQ